MNAAGPFLELNPRTLQLKGSAGIIDVTDPECRLLAAFAAAAGQRLETARMLAAVGKRADTTAKRALEVQLVRLRRKIEQAGVPAPNIKAIRGLGYQLCIPLCIAPTALPAPAANADAPHSPDQHIQSRLP